MVDIQEVFVVCPTGELFVKIWQPPDSAALVKTPVILLHDSLGCVELWRDFPQLLACALKRTVIAYDRIGFGLSTVQQQKPTLDFIFQEADASFKYVTKALNLESWILFGHSVGGAMAIDIAARWPKSCVALITESAQFRVEPLTLAGIHQAQKQFSEPQAFERLQRYHQDRTRWVLSAWIDTWLAPEFATWSMQQVVGKVKSPTLVIHGELDEYGSQEQANCIANGVSGTAKLHILPQTHHVPHRESPIVVASLVEGFLVSLR